MLPSCLSTTFLVNSLPAVAVFLMPTNVMKGETNCSTLHHCRIHRLYAGTDRVRAERPIGKVEVSRRRVKPMPSLCTHLGNEALNILD